MGREPRKDDKDGFAINPCSEMATTPKSPPNRHRSSGVYTIKIKRGTRNGFRPGKKCGVWFYTVREKNASSPLLGIKERKESKRTTRDRPGTSGFNV